MQLFWVALFSLLALCWVVTVFLCCSMGKKVKEMESSLEKIRLAYWRSEGEKDELRRKLRSITTIVKE